MTALISLLGPVARVGSVIGKYYPIHKNIFPESPNFVKTIDTPNESHSSAVIQLECGITGTFHVDADTNLKDEAYFTISGTKGILHLDDVNVFGGTLTFQPNSLDYYNPAKPVVLWKFSPYEENARGLSDLADAVWNQRKPHTAGEMAYHVLEVLTGILEGGKTGKLVDISSTCKKTAPLETKKTGIKNIFNRGNVKEMLHFYRDILGTKE